MSEPALPSNKNLVPHVGYTIGQVGHRLVRAEYQIEMCHREIILRTRFHIEIVAVMDMSVWASTLRANSVSRSAIPMTL